MKAEQGDDSAAAQPVTRQHVSPAWITRTQPAVSDLFAGRVTDDRVPSTCFAVFGPDGVVYGDGFGSIPATAEAPTLDTGYRIASCTKSFTAAALMIMRDRGRLELTDAISDWLATGSLLGPGTESVRPPTLAELASMSAGLSTDDPWADRQESMSSQTFDRMVADTLRFTADPGARYEYSNLGYALLGRGMEQATGNSVQQIITGELLQPLGLPGIAFDENGAADAIAVGHRKVDDAWVALDPTGPGAFSAIGGLYATTRSLADWCRWLAAAFVQPDQAAAQTGYGSPLSAASRIEMQTIQTPMTDAGNQGTGAARSGYGYGLQVWQHPRHGRIVQHSGGYPGYGAHMRWHPGSGVGIVALENATYSGPSRPAATALEMILDDVLGSAEEPQLWPETAAARTQVEHLIRDWDTTIADVPFADNIDLDESLVRRRAAIAELVAAVGPLDDHPLPLSQSAPISTSPAQLCWSIPGRNGLLRCEIALTPQQPPQVHTLVVRRG